MITPSSHELMQLLQAWSQGDGQALDKLTPLVYGELRRMAHRHMAKERAGHTLQTTALVNEVYLRLVKFTGMTWNDRAHFFAVCARLMRRILTDSARARHYLKRGGNARHLSFDEALVISGKPRTDFVALDDALNSLATIDPRKTQVVELRFFGGLSVEETARVLKVSADTVMRDWSFAKDWLLREMSQEKRDGA
jgi:RNA polymerase sigma-70 factor, ECF subfamily